MHNVKKPIAFICGCLTVVGLSVVGLCAYCAWAYGSGTYEAGNFHRCVYWTERDKATGALTKHWDWNYDVLSEEQELGIKLDMWIIGCCIVLAGPILYVLESSTRDKRYAGSS